MNRLQAAINVAIDAHAGQYDRGGTPYINHPMFLALQMDTEEEKIVALLHDVIEDSDKYTLNDIWLMFGGVITNAVEAITKRKDINEKYEDYLKRVASNALATKVKIADIYHNLMEERIDHVDDKYRKMAKKYEKALEFFGEKYF